MSAAALRVYDTIRGYGTQRPVLETMQTRAELYEVLSKRLPVLLESGVSVYPLSHVLEHQIAGEAAPPSGSVRVVTPTA